MASLGIHCGGNQCLNNNVLDRRQDNLCSPSNQSARLCCSMMIRGSRTESKGKRGNSFSAVAMGRTGLERPERSRRRGDGDRNGSETAALSYEKLDDWMRESVVEIVKNLREAPLLVHVYGRSAGDDKPRLETEKGVEKQMWAEIRGKWEAGEVPFPDGVIFVEELMDKDDGDGDGGDGITRAWGLVVQGKGQECGPACYLLKTSRVKVGPGCGRMSLGCTHFCLVRVNSFRETAQSQLKNSWLLQAQGI